MGVVVGAVVGVARGIGVAVGLGGREVGVAVGIGAVGLGVGAEANSAVVDPHDAKNSVVVTVRAMTMARDLLAVPMFSLHFFFL